MLIKSFGGGVIIGISVAQMMQNSATHGPTIMIAFGIGGILAGCVLLLGAYSEYKQLKNHNENKN